MQSAKITFKYLHGGSEWQKQKVLGERQFSPPEAQPGKEIGSYWILRAHMFLFYRSLIDIRQQDCASEVTGIDAYLQVSILVISSNFLTVNRHDPSSSLHSSKTKVSN
nr:hypothetical protein Iba_scaffold40694CG0010 [Ipomoea batatas]GME03932.1 hypothetical protein Iba_scaffold1421CG0330 [Ipomoea batatas]